MTTLLEREPARLDIARAMATARTVGQLVGVCGEAGIGKSSLVRAVAEATADSHQWLWGYCDALGTPRPLGPLTDMAAELGADVSEGLGSGVPRHVLFATVLEALRRRSRPTVVCVEDVHWADDATLDWLQFLTRRLASTRTTLLLTWRDDEIPSDHALRLVLSAAVPAAVHRVVLAPLSRAAVAELAGAGVDASALHGLTKGNPFFVTELVGHPSSDVPASVRDAVLARRARLDPQARAMLDLVSVVPSKCELPLLRAATGDDLAGLEACLGSGLLRGDTDAVSFRHELARRAVADALSPPSALVCHRRVLEALLNDPARGRALPRVVHHAEACGARDVVATVGPRAGREAASVGAHRQAVEHYLRALRHADEADPAARATLIESVAYERYLIGEIDAARAARREALALSTRHGDRDAVGRNTRWLSRLSWFMGEGAEASRLADQAIEVLRQGEATIELAWAYTNRAQLDMLSDALAPCLYWGEQAIALARELDAPEVLSHALNNVGTARRLAGDADGCTQQQESLDLALAHDLHEHAARAYTNLASAAIEMREYADARRILDAGLAYCLDRDLDSWSTYMTAWRARLRAEAGLWQGACDDAEAVLGSPRPNNVSSLTALTVLASVRVRRGAPGAEEPLARALDLARRTGELQRLGPVMLVLSERAWLAGEHDEAAAHATEGLDLATSSRRPFLRGRLAVRLWRASGRATTEGTSGPDALTLAGQWQAAAAGWRRLGCPYEEAEALMDGDVDAVHAAHAIFHTLGAAPAADWARQRLRQLGVSHVPRGRRASTLAHPAGLTARETEILGLVAQQLTNSQIGDRLFVSAKTVEHHVSSILSKLDVANRDAAVARARSAGWIPDRRGAN